MWLNNSNFWNGYCKMCTFFHFQFINHFSLSSDFRWTIKKAAVSNFPNHLKSDYPCYKFRFKTINTDIF